MRRVLLVAWHEFVKYVTRRGFIIGVFLMPLWIVLAAIVPRLIEQSVPPRIFTVVDRVGGFAPAIAQAVAERDARQNLTALSAYAKANVDLAALRAHVPGLADVLAAPDGDHDALAVFEHVGGLPAVEKAMRPYTRQGAPPFKPEPPRYRYIPAPAALMTATPQNFASRAATILSDKVGFDAVVVIPPGFGKTAAADYWTSGAPKPDLQTFVQQILTEILRKQALQSVAPDQSSAILDVSAQLNNLDPSGRGAGHALSLQDKAQRYAPSVIAFLLVLTIFMNAASLMSAVIEEKSNRIVEVLLSCVSPREFMIGKLLGAAGASFLTLGIWFSMLVVAASVFIPDGLHLIGVVLYSIVSGPMLPLLVLCFVCGLLIYASIFLAIGSMATSVQDAQALLGPTMIIVMAPLLIMPALLQDPNGVVATTMTWVPVYTPFFMMFRLPWHPPQWQVVSALILMVATSVLLVLQMGRVFANNVLTSERPPKPSAILRGLMGLKKASGVS